MPEIASPDSIAQIPGATASNPFPKMAKDEQVHFVIKRGPKFPKKTFAAILFLAIVASLTGYVVYRNSHTQFANVNDVENPTISITKPQNADVLKGQAPIVVSLADNSFSQKTYKAVNSSLKVESGQTQSLVISVGDALDRVTSAQLWYETSSITSQDQCQIRVSTAAFQNCGPTYTAEQTPQKQTLNLDISNIKTGENTFEFKASQNSSFTVTNPMLVVAFGDPNTQGKVVKVEFLVDDKVVGDKTDFTLPFALDTTKFENGAHVLLAKAFDEAGNTSYSAPRNITIQN